MSNIVSKRNSVVHRIAQCTECDWTDEEYKNALVRARRHCARTGHRVIVESAYTITYSFNKEAPDGPQT